MDYHCLVFALDKHNMKILSTWPYVLKINELTATNLKGPYTKFINKLKTLKLDESIQSFKKARSRHKNLETKLYRIPAFLKHGITDKENLKNQI